MATEQTEVRPCCVTGHVHKGDPLGSMSTLHDLHCYISKPTHTTQTAGNKVDKVVFVPDIFGIYPNAKLLADEWAGQGYEVIIPDLFEGGNVDHELLNTIVPNLRAQAEATTISKAADTAKTAAALGPFLISNREAVTKPKLEAFVQAIKADHNTGHVIALGFCWGARYALLLARDDSPAKVDAAIGMHPSFLTNDDVRDIKTTPCAIFKGTKDAMMTDDALKEVEDIMSANLPTSKLLVKTFPDAVHGFTIRGDMEDGQEKQQKEEANNAAMAFLKQAFGPASVV